MDQKLKTWNILRGQTKGKSPFAVSHAVMTWPQAWCLIEVCPAINRRPEQVSSENQEISYQPLMIAESPAL